MVTGTILITSAEPLLKNLDMPFNKTNAFWIVRTACSQIESPLGGKLFVEVAYNFCNVQLKGTIYYYARIDPFSMFSMTGVGGFLCSNQCVDLVTCWMILFIGKMAHVGTFIANFLFSLT